MPAREVDARGEVVDAVARDAGAVASQNGYIDIPAGESFALVELNAIDDASPEGDETVQLTLRPHARYATGTRTGGTVVIADDDGSFKPGPGSAARPPGHALRAPGTPHVLDEGDPLDDVTSRRRR